MEAVTETGAPVPEYLQPAEGPFTELESFSGIFGFICGIRTTGELECWGDEQDGLDPPLPGKGLLDAPEGTFAAVSARGRGACAIRTDQTLACWGRDTGEYEGLTTPPEGTFTAVRHGGTHVCALSTEGHIQCWGNNSNGQLDVP